MYNSESNSIITETANFFESLLQTYQILHEKTDLYDGYQWFFADYPKGDIIIHSGSYSSSEGYLESFNMPWDNGDVSVCTPHEMIKRLIEYKGKESDIDNEKHYNMDDFINSWKFIFRD